MKSRSRGARLVIFGSEVLCNDAVGIKIALARNQVEIHNDCVLLLCIALYNGLENRKS